MENVYGSTRNERLICMSYLYLFIQVVVQSALLYNLRMQWKQSAFRYNISMLRKRYWLISDARCTCAIRHRYAKAEKRYRDMTANERRQVGR